MIAFLLSPLGRWIGVGIGAGLLAGIIWLNGDHHGAARVQVRFDAYKVQVQKDVAAEQARQKSAAEQAVAALQIQLDAAEADQAAAQKAADDLRDLIASRPPVPGRGATEDDVRALR